MFVVETFTLFGGWKNCWSVDDVPQTFKTKDEAALELFEHAKDCRESGVGFESTDYRIRRTDETD